MSLPRRSRAVPLLALAAVVITALLISVLLLPRGDRTLSRTGYMLDTVVTVTLRDWSDEGTLERVFYEIERLERLFSVGDPESDLHRLNANAGNWVELSDETCELLERAVDFYELTGGLFDPTVQPLVELWDIAGGGHVPTADELEEALALVDGSQLEVGDMCARLGREGMAVTLGGIAKGYIADRIAELLEGEGVEHAIIDLGHNILLVGSKPDGSPWRVGVQDPDGTGGEYAAVIEADGLSVVTSGTYERYFELDGVRWHHVLDPFSGYPSESGLVSATVVCESSTAADALSTACLIAGAERALELIEEMDGVEVLLIDQSGEMYMSDGMGDFLADN